MPELDKCLVLACGNPARGDDGLGPALARRLEQAAHAGLEIRLDFQLRVEDAMDIGSFQHVLFVDASSRADPPFRHYPLAIDAQPTELNTHSVSPEALMFLARTLFGADAGASVLAIRGYEFEPFRESLSPKAEENLVRAFEFLDSKCRRGTLAL